MNKLFGNSIKLLSQPKYRFGVMGNQHLEKDAEVPSILLSE